MITSLEMSRFRGHTIKHSFGPGRNKIKGANESGKSSIKEAIAFAMMGTDSEGTKNPDYLVSVDSTEMEVSLTTPKSIIKRRKRRGATSEIKLLRPGIPDIKLTQTDIMGQIGISTEVFMSSWLTGYFMRLKADAQLKVLGEIAKIDRKSLLAETVSLEDVPSIVKLINPRIDADAVAGVRRQEQNKLTAAEASVQSLTQSLSTPINLSPEDLNIKNGRIAELTSIVEDHRIYEKAAANYKAAVDKKAEGQKAGNDLLKAAEVDRKRGETLLIEGATLSKKAEAAYLSREALAKEAEALKAGKITVTIIPPKKPSASKGTCPTCTQDVGEEHIKKLMSVYEKDLMAYNKHERDVANTNQKIDAALVDLRSRYDVVSKAYTLSKEAIEKNSREFKDIEHNFKRLEGMLKNTKSNEADPIPPAVPVGDLSALTKEKEELNAQVHAFTMYQTQIERVTKQIVVHKNEIVKHKMVIDKLVVVEKALQDLPRRETEKTLEQVAVPSVKLSLTDGEFTVHDSKGVDYRSLSDGRKMKVDIALAVAIKYAVGPTAPQWLFIDNADLMDSQLEVPDGMQVLIAEVDPEALEVQVISL